jgi:hypothetical protein
MKKTILLGLFLFLIGFTVNSQDNVYARFIVSKLASPEFKGRGYVDNGDKLAAAFIKDEFVKLCLKPVNKDYFQEFSVPVNTFPGKVVLEIPVDILTPGVDFLVEACSPSVSGSFEVVTATRQQLGDKEILVKKIKQAAGKLLLIDNRLKKEESKEEAKYADKIIDALKYDQDIKVKGIIILTHEKLNWEASASLNSKPVIIISKDIDPDKVKTVKLKIKSKFIKNYETRNVTAIIEGKTVPDSFIVVTAHYDHLGILGKDVYFPGANDNASGVAMMLSLAKHYSVNKPEYSMVFVALAAEELGLLGAQEFITEPPVKLKKIKFLANFDLAGTGDEGIRVVNGSVYKNKFDLLTRINDENKLLPKIDIRGEACISDHCPFYQQGVPCFFIYTQGGIKAYHDIYDRYEILPFTEFKDYCDLMIKFFDTFRAD